MNFLVTQLVCERTDWSGWTGIVIDGAVTGKWHKDALLLDHHAILGDHVKSTWYHDHWRYDIKSQLVLWNSTDTESHAESREAVINFLERRRLPVQGHVRYNTWLDRETG